MSELIDPDSLQSLTRTCQILVAALIMGVVAFLAILLLFVPAGLAMVPVPAGGAAVPAPAGRGFPVITYIAVAVGLADLALSFVVPRVTTASGRRQIAQGVAPKIKGGPLQPKQLDVSGDVALLAPVYQTQLIIGSAVLEGGAFFAAIAYMVERQPIALGMTLVLLAVLASGFPTGERVRAWFNQQLGLLQEERQSIL